MGMKKCSAMLDSAYRRAWMLRIASLEKDSFLVSFLVFSTASAQRGNDMDKQTLVEILRSEVDRANQEYVRAKQSFSNVCSDAPSGIPHPDGKQRIELAARAQTSAMAAYAKALHRFNQLILDGVIPEDLGESGVARPSVRRAEVRELEKCEYCGAETLLRDHGYPICIECADRLDTGEKLTRKKPAHETGSPAMRKLAAG